MASVSTPLSSTSSSAATAGSSSVTVKIFANGDIRRCTLNEVSMERVRSLVQELYPSMPTTFNIKFADDEDELVTVSTTSELRDAIALLNAAGHKVLKLHVTPNTSSDERSTTASSSASGDDDFVLLKPAPAAVPAPAVSPAAAAQPAAAPSPAASAPASPSSQSSEGVAKKPAPTPAGTEGSSAAAPELPNCEELKQLALAFLGDSGVLAELPGVVSSIVDSLLSLAETTAAASASADKKSGDKPSSVAIIDRALSGAARIRSSSLVTRLLPLLPRVAPLIDTKLALVLTHVHPHHIAMARAWQPMIPELVKKATESIPQLLAMLPLLAPLLRDLCEGGASAGFDTPFASLFAGLPLFGGFCAPPPFARPPPPFGGFGFGGPFGGRPHHAFGGPCDPRFGGAPGFHGGHHHHHHHRGPFGHHMPPPPHHFFRGMMHGMPPPPPPHFFGGHHHGAFPSPPPPPPPFGASSFDFFGRGRGGWARFGAAVPPAPTPEATSAPAASSSSEGVHQDIYCDGCGQKPLRGLRYKCTICPDYDLCSTCEAKGSHPAEHPLVKIRAPVPATSPSEGVHIGVTCDGCGISPITGIRWKCSVCPDFDLCQTCEPKGVHPAEHPMIKIRHAASRGAAAAAPAGGPWCRRRGGEGREGHHFGWGGPCRWRRWAARAAEAMSAATAPTPATPAAAPAATSTPSVPKETKEPVAAATASSSSAPAVPTPTASSSNGAVAAPAAGTIAGGRYDVQLQALAAMGFGNVELNTYLLDRNAGNLQTVANWLIEKQIAH